jgi:hypothetical protein
MILKHYPRYRCSSVDTEIAKRGQTDDIFPTKRPENLEKWWNESFDIIDDWNKFQD